MRKFTPNFISTQTATNLRKTAHYLAMPRPLLGQNKQQYVVRCNGRKIKRDDRANFERTASWTTDVRFAVCRRGSCMWFMRGFIVLANSDGGTTHVRTYVERTTTDERHARAHYYGED